MGITQPCFYSSDGIITRANKEFIEFAGFTMDEMLGKSLKQIGDMIRINTQIHLYNIIERYCGYVFTKALSSREVKILYS